MELKGKIINFLGDSITEGAGISAQNKHFFDVLKSRCELLEVRNYGISGTRIARQRSVSGNPRWDLDFCSRVEKMNENADIVVIFGGTNDFGHGDAPLGQMSDRTEYTFYGALHVLITSVIEKFPKSTVVFMTPLHRCNEDNMKGDGYKSEDVATLKTYVDIIKEVTEYYSIPTLDLFSISGIQPKIDKIKELYCPDGLHPNDEGHKIIASRLEGFLKAL